MRVFIWLSSFHAKIQSLVHIFHSLAYIFDWFIVVVSFVQIDGRFILFMSMKKLDNSLFSNLFQSCSSILTLKFSSRSSTRIKYENFSCNFCSFSKTYLKFITLYYKICIYVFSRFYWWMSKVLHFHQPSFIISFSFPLLIE